MGTSTYEAFWNCLECGYGTDGEWKSTVAYRHRGRYAACPSCGYDWRFGNAIKVRRGRVPVSNENNLETNCTEILSEWDYERNDLLPSEVATYSSQEMHWICSKCNHEFRSIVAHRIRGSKLHKFLMYCNRLEYMIKKSLMLKNEIMTKVDFEYA